MLRYCKSIFLAVNIHYILFIGVSNVPHFAFKITKAHVDEAFRLLNKSIIRVEQPDIHLDEEDEGALINAEDEEEEEPLIDGSQTPRRQVEDGPPQGMDIDDLEPLSPRPATQHPQKKKMRLNYDEYKSMSNLIIMYMRREENRLEEEGSDSEGLKRSQVVNWYLSEIEDDIETEEELLEKKELVEKVIDRLVHHVSHPVVLTMIFNEEWQ